MERKSIPANTAPGVLAAALSAGAHKYEGYKGWDDKTMAMKVIDFAAVLIEELNSRTPTAPVIVPKEVADQMDAAVTSFTRKRGRLPKAGEVIPID